MSEADRYPFLSEEWILRARKLRESYEDRLPSAQTPSRINVVVTDIPHRDDLHGHIASESGEAVVLEEDHLDDADLLLKIDYATAKAAFIDRDQQVVMQGFLAGKIYVEGDISPLMASMGPPDPEHEPLLVELYSEMRGFTADD